MKQTTCSIRRSPLERPKRKFIYKDLSIEDLKDEGLMASLRKVMENAGVDRATVEKLFQSGAAAAAQGSFEGM